MHRFAPFVSIAAVVAVAPGIVGSSAIPNGMNDLIDCGTITDPTYGVDHCLCRPSIPAFVDTDQTTLAGISQGLFSRSQAIGALHAGLTESKKWGTAQTCIFPENSTPTSSSSCSRDDPCEFTCNEWYELRDGECNEIPEHRLAARAPQATTRKRSFDWRSARCSRSNEKVCAISHHGSLAYECLDIQSNLESCGGCTTALEPGDKTGEDCTSLPGIADVECTAGGCQIYSCRRGFVLSTALDGTGRQACLSREENARKAEPMFDLGRGIYDYSVTADNLLKLVQFLKEYKDINYVPVIGAEKVEEAKYIIAKRTM